MKAIKEALTSPSQNKLALGKLHELAISADQPSVRDRFKTIVPALIQLRKEQGNKYL